MVRTLRRYSIYGLEPVEMLLPCLPNGLFLDPLRRDPPLGQILGRLLPLVNDRHQVVNKPLTQVTSNILAENADQRCMPPLLPLSRQ